MAMGQPTPRGKIRKLVEAVDRTVRGRARCWRVTRLVPLDFLVNINI
jgi:hypothetical protein